MATEFLYSKHFELEEAKSWVPRLRQDFARIQALYQEAQELQQDYNRIKVRIQQNGHAPKESGFEERIAELNSIVKKIIDAGIEVKDIQRGLVDFPTILNGEEVFLCFELSDPDIEYWHRIEAGYAGRTLIL